MDGPWRGRIDLLGFDATVGRLVVVEVKTELRDAGGLERQVDRYARLCLDVARRRGWRVGEVAVAVLVLATAETDAFLVANREVMAGAFPIRGRAAIECIFDREPIRGRLLLMLDPRRRGRRVVGRARVDGRRTPAPYHDYRAFVAAISGTGHDPAARSPRPLTAASRGEVRGWIAAAGHAAGDSFDGSAPNGLPHASGRGPGDGGLIGAGRRPERGAEAGA